VLVTARRFFIYCRSRGLEPFGKRRKEFGEAKGREAEHAGAGESNEALIKTDVQSLFYLMARFKFEMNHLFGACVLECGSKQSATPLWWNLELSCL
jgi:hypothetical protein